ncbi:MAG: hypothetical protein KJN71_09530 [Acidimicrobiia bacterium]|nr:hypothetical protein [Acidimicrobiia bacterium]
MAFADDYSIAANGDIRHVSGTTNYTVLEMHRALMDKADDAVAAGNDIMDISVLTPSDRSTDNIVTLLNNFNIDDTAAQYLYDGSVTQTNGDTIYAGLVVVGSVEAGTNIIIKQDNALLTDTWTSAPNADAAANILLRCLVKTRDEGANIDGQRLLVEAREYGDTYAEFSVTMGLGNNTAALFTSNDLNNATAQATVNTYDKIDYTAGYQELEISGTAPAEPYYGQWEYTGAGTLPAAPAINDVYEFAKDIQRRGTAETIHGMGGALFRGITHEWAYDGVVTSAPTTNDEIVWGAFLDGTHVGTFTVGEVVTGGTSGAVGRVLSSDETNDSLVVSTESGTWTVGGEVITGTTSSATCTTVGAHVGQNTGGGRATVLAIDDGGTDEVWVQLLVGTPPTDNTICYEDTDHTDSLTVFGSVTSRSVSTPFIGASTGSALLGAFGIGLKPGDASESDLFIDLDGTPVTPPNNVTFTVTGLENGEDRVLVGPDNAGALDVAQFANNGALSSGATSVVVKVGNETPGTGTNSEDDTPDTGTIRVQGDDGIYYRVTYTGYTVGASTMTFTGCAGLNDDAAVDNNIFISYIDDIAGAPEELSFSSVYSGSDRTLFIRVRDGGTAGDTEGIKTFESTGTLGSSGGSAPAIRTPDV